MAKRGRKRLKGLGFAPDRWVVFAPEGVFDRRGKQVKPACSKTTYTSYGDAAKATLRCSRYEHAKEPCLLMSGWSSGSDHPVGRCRKGRCSKPKAEDLKLIATCKLSKKDRKALLKKMTQADKTQIAIRNIRTGKSAGSLTPSQAAKSGVVMSGARGKGRKRR
jgi:hypothetical protein